MIESIDRPNIYCPLSVYFNKCVFLHYTSKNKDANINVISEGSPRTQ